MADNRGVFLIRDVDADAILDTVNIEDISALVFYQRIKQRHLDIANLDEAMGQVAPNESQAAGNQDRSAAISDFSK